VRQYHEDREVTAWFLLDLSPSMDFGSVQSLKRTVLIDFVATMARLLTRHGNRVGALFYGDGLERTGTAVRLDDLARYAAVSIDAGESRYRLPLVRDCRRLARGLSPDDEVVLLGSIATPKYLAILEPIFGDRLRVPRDFIGRGDMSRGALLLRAVRAASELEYISARALRAEPADPLP